MQNLIIRRSKIKRDLILTRNAEKVYWIYLFGKDVDNGLDYTEMSDKFNELEKQ